MGADNWAVCPQCLDKTVQARVNALKIAEDSYGKIPAEEFIKRRDEAVAMPLQVKESLAEYEHLGITPEGLFYIEYNSSCNNCGFSFLYTYDQQVYPERK